MSSRLDPAWTVWASLQTTQTDRCVDFFSRPDGTFGFEEFRRDAEDMGVWTPIAYFSATTYRSQPDAVAAARRLVTWLGEILDR